MECLEAAICFSFRRQQKKKRIENKRLEQTRKKEQPKCLVSIINLNAIAAIRVF